MSSSVGGRMPRPTHHRLDVEAAEASSIHHLTCGNFRLLWSKTSRHHMNGRDLSSERRRELRVVEVSLSVLLSLNRLRMRSSTCLVFSLACSIVAVSGRRTSTANWSRISVGKYFCSKRNVIARKNRPIATANVIHFTRMQTFQLSDRLNPQRNTGYV